MESIPGHPESLPWKDGGRGTASMASAWNPSGALVLSGRRVTRRGRQGGKKVRGDRGRELRSH